MIHSIKYLLVGATLVAGLAGCSSSDGGRQQAVLDGIQGERVSSVCFLRDIRNWHALDQQSVIIQKGRDEYFRLELDGACDARQTFLTLRAESRSGICLAPGDRISFPRDQGVSCRIRNIYQWHPADTTTE